MGWADFWAKTTGGLGESSIIHGLTFLGPAQPIRTPDTYYQFYQDNWQSPYDCQLPTHTIMKIFVVDTENYHQLSIVSIRLQCLHSFNQSQIVFNILRILVEEYLLSDQQKNHLNYSDLCWSSYESCWQEYFYFYLIHWLKIQMSKGETTDVWLNDLIWFIRF